MTSNKWENWTKRCGIQARCVGIWNRLRYSRYLAGIWPARARCVLEVTTCAPLRPIGLIDVDPGPHDLEMDSTPPTSE